MRKSVVHAYVRVSRDSQTIDQQRAAIEAAYPDGTEFEWYEEIVSGWEGKRLEYDLLCRLIERGSVSELCCYSVSRLGRNVQRAAEFMLACQKRNVKVRVLKENLDFGGPFGFALWTLFAALAQMDSDTKSQATRAKLQYKIQVEGWKPHGQPPHCVSRKARMKARTVYTLLDSGQSQAHIARQLEITEHTVGKIVRLRGSYLVVSADWQKLFPLWQHTPKDQLASADEVQRRYREVFGTQQWD